MSKIILFIPFTISENNFSLYMRALSWRYNLRNLEENSDNVPSIVMYHHPDENAEDYDDYPEAQFHFTPENVDPDTVIYILADGTGDPRCVVNVNQVYYEHFSQEPYQLPIDAVAWRMKQCGLTPQLAENVKGINLFICDENNTNDQLAVFFAQGLGKKYKDVAINYYSSIVYIPQPISSDKVKKLAYLHIYSSDGTTKQVEAGYAHEHKHTLNVSDAFTQEESSYHCLRKSKALLLPTFRELSSTRCSLSIEEIIDTEDTQFRSDQELKSPTITFPEDEQDTENEINSTSHAERKIESQPAKPSTAIIVRQERSIFFFFKSIAESDKKSLLHTSNCSPNNFK
ncbi:MULTISPECIES: hypothetical protein [Legionella]|uniref:Uncharacterized protein n=1 Tax=Legionella resiliens TaxID=2905958 RepID=A0ABS8X7X9_9GAMM|nr:MULTISPECIES: hypothetical protein [unclassified Legionella]MCE0724383.1 hypothetical protein [Legionella sp. 9fVS26]MCE3533535.1 hypothetical protein [Legionella sp. 8cVS16]QLZ69723.1 hypothetical protein FOLKNPGA_02521 [Legionella sp. PC1000]